MHFFMFILRLGFFGKYNSMLGFSMNAQYSTVINRYFFVNYMLQTFAYLMTTLLDKKHVFLIKVQGPIFHIKQQSMFFLIISKRNSSKCFLTYLFGFKYVLGEPYSLLDDYSHGLASADSW